MCDVKMLSAQVPVELAEQLEKMHKRIANSELYTFASVSRSQVVRMALIEGLAVLEKHFKDKDGQASCDKKSIGQLCIESHENAIDKGFYENERNVGELLMLITSEIGECLEAFRHGNPESEKIRMYSHAEEELADACIRIFDMCEYLDFDLEGAILSKMEYNSGREKKHGKLF